MTVVVIAVVSGGCGNSKSTTSSGAAQGSQTGHATAAGETGRIAFRRYFDAAHAVGAIFTINTDGSRVHQVTHPPSGMYDDQPDWSPDGSQLVFARCGPNSCAVYVVHSDGTGLVRISPPCPGNATPPKCEDDNNAAFLPDGQHVSFTRAHGLIRKVPGGQQIQHSDIVVTDLNGGHRRTILRSGPYQADYNYAGFSPNGRMFVYEHHNSPLAQPGNGVALFVATRAGKDDHRITPWALAAGDNPEFSPDGNWIVFRSHVDSDIGSNIYKVHPDGTGLQRLTHLSGNVESASFSPDGRSIVFATVPSGSANAALYIMKDDGTQAHQITHSTYWDSAPDWGLAK